jgi:non-haem dioxygenase in morphine synthesis N-terminal
VFTGTLVVNTNQKLGSLFSFGYCNYSNFYAPELNMGRTIPVIDVSDFERRRVEISSEILRAAAEVGFLQIINHGIPQQLVDDMFAKSEAFFALDDSIKAKYPMDKMENRGWEKLGQVRPSTGTF